MRIDTPNRFPSTPFRVDAAARRFQVFTDADDDTGLSRAEQRQTANNVNCD
jgi:hypothetical protein